MKKILSVLATLAICATSFGQLVQVTHETVYTDDGMVMGYPTGHSTYRIYAEMTSSSDILSAVFALNDDLLFLGSTNGNVWNDAFGDANGSVINAAFFVPFPALEYDSWVTIGRAPGDAGESVTLLDVDPATAFTDVLGTTVSASGIQLNDGSWSTIPTGSNATGTGMNNRILLAQITTDGDVLYQLNLQVTLGGIGGTVVQYVADASLAGTGQQANASLAYPALVDTGCTDNTACNYDAGATVDDGQCDFSCYGCTDVDACNYDATSTIDDGMCDFSCYGCMNNTACNYDAAATADNPAYNTPCFFVGDSCDDGDATTSNDEIQADCSCSGIAPLTLSPFGSCVTTSGTVGASAAIFTIVPNGAGMHLEVTTTAFDAMIDIDGPGFSTDFTVDNTAGTGDEYFNGLNLQGGETYVITISSNAGTGAFDICATDLPETRYDYAGGNYDLCAPAKADWVGAENYRFRFINTLGQVAAEYETGAAITTTVLRLIDGLVPNELYFVRCDAGYTVDAVGGGTDFVWVLGSNATNITVTTPTIAIDENDNCTNAGPRFLGHYIDARPYVCGADKFEWTFATSGQLPITYTRNSNNRYLRLSSVPGLLEGTEYNVSVRAGYPNGAFTASSEIECISIVGNAPGVIDGPAAEEVFVLDRIEDASSAAIYPNPVRGDIINVNLSGVSGTAVNMDIYNTFGKLVQSEQLNVVQSNVNQVVTLTDLASGVYVVNFLIDGQQITERLVVQH